MALKTRCQTPGTHFRTRIAADKISIEITPPPDVLGDLDEEGATLLERNMHNALELVLAVRFVPRGPDKFVDEIEGNGWTEGLPIRVRNRLAAAAGELGGAGVQSLARIGKTRLRLAGFGDDAIAQIESWLRSRFNYELMA